MQNTLDFVITWVDGNDKRWQEEKNKYTASASQTDSRNERYRDWDNLRYWFRGVEQCAQWVHKIYFVTWGHIPEWLNTAHPKLQIIKHTDFIPEQYLPTFNSHTIELNLHRISGLSENFVYFNDDVFLIHNVTAQEFFRNNLPCDMLALQPVVSNPANPVMSHIFLNNTLVLSKHFNKRENIKSQLRSYYKPGYPVKYFGYNLLELAFPLFSGLYTTHGPAPLCKSTYETLWEKEYEILDTTCSHKFRHCDDVNQYLLREWQKLSGNFVPFNVCRHFEYFNISDDNRKLVSVIKKQKKPVVCINDANDKINFEAAKTEINAAFETIFPKKSSFER